jgi:5-methylthioadenosine/S-adenosylhomocysteine deaminase
MRATQLIHRAHWVDGNLLPAAQVLEMTTSGAAQALGLSDVGKLEAGCLADLILLDGSFYQPVTEFNLIDLLVSQRNAVHVRTVIIDGLMVMDNGHLLTLDLDKVKAEALEASEALWMKNGFTSNRL